MAEMYSVHLIDLYSDSGLFPLIPINNSTYFLDGLHLNAAGGVVVANCIHRAL